MRAVLKDSSGSVVYDTFCDSERYEVQEDLIDKLYDLIDDLPETDESHHTTWTIEVWS